MLTTMTSSASPASSVSLADRAPRGTLTPGTLSPERHVPASIARPEYMFHDGPERVTASEIKDAETIERIRVAGRLAARALAEPKPKKRRLRKLTGTLALIGGTVGAAYLLWKRSQPVEDPWAEAYWEDVTEETAAEPAPEDEDGSEAGRHKA